MDGLSWTTRIARTSLMRGLADMLLRRKARRRVLALDACNSGRQQLHQLTKLVRQARRTPFGQAHDFQRIRNHSDYCRLVPLSTAEQTGCDEFTQSSVFSETAVLLTALGWTLDRKPASRFLSGTVMRLGSRIPCSLLSAYSMDCEVDELPPVEVLSQLPVTLITGSTDQLEKLRCQLRERSGCDNLSDTWPGLLAVFEEKSPTHGDGISATTDKPFSLAACSHPHGLLAMRDPRSDAWRIVPDIGIFYEFIPLADIGSAHPTRLTLGEVATDVPYGIAMTTPSAWSCLTEWTTTFLSVEPPVVEGFTPLQSGLLPLTPPAALPYHPRSADMPAALAERSDRSLSSARADRR